MMSHRVLVPPDLSGSGRQYLLDRYYELIVSKEMRERECCADLRRSTAAWRIIVQ